MNSSAEIVESCQLLLADYEESYVSRKSIAEERGPRLTYAAQASSRTRYALCNTLAPLNSSRTFRHGQASLLTGAVRASYPPRKRTACPREHKNRKTCHVAGFSVVTSHFSQSLKMLATPARHLAKRSIKLRLAQKQKNLPKGRCFCLLCSRRDSNPQQRFRRPV